MTDDQFECPCDEMVTFEQAISVALNVGDVYQFMANLWGIPRYSAKIAVYRILYSGAPVVVVDHLAALWRRGSTGLAETVRPGHVRGHHAAATLHTHLRESTPTPRGSPSTGDTAMKIYVYAGFRYEIVTDETGECVQANPVAGQHPASRKEKHRMAARSEYNSQR